MDSRERYRQVLTKYRLNPHAPGGAVCWSPELECAPRSRIREIQGDKLVAAVAFLWDYSPLYRRMLEQSKLAPADIKSIDDLHKLPILRREHFEFVAATFIRARSKMSCAGWGHQRGLRGGDRETGRGGPRDRSL
jgi:hypothetical protein